MNTNGNSVETKPDVLLIGAGIMSATLGVLLKELQPNLKIQIFERLEGAAAESSDAWNNAGTGHAAFCELNYTPQLPDGTIETVKAVKIAESFEVSRQFWSFLVDRGFLKDPENFIRRTPHLSFVWGEKNVEYLKKRYEAMQHSPLFAEMSYSEDTQQLSEWMPLVMEGRDPAQKVAATYMPIGTDVNFGSLTRAMFQQLQDMEGVNLHFNQEVKSFKQTVDKRWQVKVQDRKSGKTTEYNAKFVFIGAGGWSLPMLLKTGIPEGKGYGGFPVGGQWLKCTNPAIIERHSTKVYGKASLGAPPMSVPHLDTRMIDGKQALLFGPYAGFSTKFLKTGSLLDLPLSVKFSNIIPLLWVAVRELKLTKYLIGQVLQKPKDRLAALQEYFPGAKLEDWKLEIAGQRVQVIKKDAEKGGKLEFGTEVVAAKDGSIAALLGASPGASTTISIMLDLMEKCFKDQMGSAEWQAKLKQMIPSYGKKLTDDAALCAQIRKQTSETLKLNF